jgi:hypothetical protein
MSKKDKHTSRNRWMMFTLILLALNLMAPFVWFITILHFLVKHSKQEKNHAERIEDIDKKPFKDYVITRNQEKPPLTMGPQRLHYIFATTLPQIYLTLLSVLQGLVFGVLLYNIPLPQNISLANIFAFSIQQYLYLPYIVSSLVMLIVWNQFVHGILFLTWPFTVFQSSLIFLMSLAEILTFAHANLLPEWLFGLGLIAIIGAIIRFNNIRFLPNDEQQKIAPVNNYAVFSKSTEKSDGVLYISVGIIVLVCSISFNAVIKAVSMFGTLFPSLIRWGILILLLLMAFGILFFDKRNRRTYLNIFISGSDLVIGPHDIIGYQKDDENEV